VFNASSRCFIGRSPITYRFFLIDSFLCLDTSAVFKILRLHFLMMFRFCAAILSIIRFASSRKVTSRYQYMLSIQYPSIFLYVFVHRPLIPFQRQHIIRSFSFDFLCDCRLCSHGLKKEVGGS